MSEQQQQPQQQTTTIDPFAAAAHHKAKAEWLDARCMLLQQAVIQQETLLAELREQLTQRDAEIARLDAEREAGD